MSERLSPSGAVYVLPLRRDRPDDGKLGDYLSRLATWIDVVVIDGSPPDVFAAHHARWSGYLTHLAPRSVGHDENGKAVGVVEGLRATTAPLVIIADDDVRYDKAGLDRAVTLLDEADLVRPQNFFHPLPWHAHWDTARMLLNRSTGGDYPGTLAVRRQVLPYGYDTHVLFENLELIRTVRASGGRELRAHDLFVERRPPSTSRFLSQRVRQAYDSQAQPVRLLIELLLLPTAIWAARRPMCWAALMAAAVLVAHLGRGKAGAGARFSLASPLFAPVWIMERAVCSWVALGCRMTGGIRYAGSRLRIAAHSERWIRAHGLSNLPPSPSQHPESVPVGQESHAR